MMTWIIFLGGMVSILCAQKTVTPDAALDSDKDGIADSLENALLAQFSPVFMVSRTDCSVLPAQFELGAKDPTVIADDGTIYGQVFPRNGHPEEVELHYYHLWQKDCGEFGHALDAEHVSALIQLGHGADSAKALYWYAAAHEDTICDASHLVRAKTISAEGRGPAVWISPGKHASFLSDVLCASGCGGDRCEDMQKLKVRSMINVGEIGNPMNNIAWLSAPEWPLQDKLSRSDFTDNRLARVDRLPETDLVWANPSKRPAQAAIFGANAGIGGVATGTRETDTALVIANYKTGSALGIASGKTEGALKISSRNVWKVLKKSLQNTGDLLKQPSE